MMNMCLILQHLKIDGRNWPENCLDSKQDDILNYFIYSKDPLSGKFKKCKRQLKKAIWLCDEHFLWSTKVDHVNDTYSVIATDVDEVWGILKKWWENLWPLQPHVTINKTGQIENPPCNCKAGKTELCIYVGAFLFAVIKIKSPCTSGDCKWKIQRPPSPQRLQDIKFFTSDYPPPPPNPLHYSDVYMSGYCKDSDVFLKDILERLGHAHPGAD